MQTVTVDLASYQRESARLSSMEKRIAELEAENAKMRLERDELRDILQGIGRQAEAAARCPAADLIAAAEAKAKDR